jgi:hypothetical protein
LTLHSPQAKNFPQRISVFALRHTKIIFYLQLAANRCKYLQITASPTVFDWKSDDEADESIGAFPGTPYRDFLVLGES